MVKRESGGKEVEWREKTVGRECEGKETSAMKGRERR